MKQNRYKLSYDKHGISNQWGKVSQFSEPHLLCKEFTGGRKSKVSSSFHTHKIFQIDSESKIRNKPSGYFCSTKKKKKKKIPFFVSLGHRKTFWSIRNPEAGKDEPDRRGHIKV